MVRYHHQLAYQRWSDMFSHTQIHFCWFIVYPRKISPPNGWYNPTKKKTFPAWLATNFAAFTNPRFFGNILIPGGILNQTEKENNCIPMIFIRTINQPISEPTSPCWWLRNLAFLGLNPRMPDEISTRPRFTQHGPNRWTENGISCGQYPKIMLLLSGNQPWQWKNVHV